MSRLLAQCFVLAALAVVDTATAAQQNSGSSAVQTANAADPDAGLFTLYALNSSNQTVDWTTCNGQQHTCSLSGALGPFGMVGALIEGNPIRHKYKGINRDIYVLDTAAGPSKDGVTLNVYERTRSGSIENSPKKRLELGLVGGAQATISMAATNEYILVGSSLSQDLAQVAKKNFEISMLPSFFFGSAYTGMTTTGAFVNVVQGDGSFANFTVYDQQGNVAVDGSGTPFLLNEKTAIKPSQP